MLQRFLPPGTAQRSYMLSLMALIVSTLFFFILGALTKNTPNPSTGLLILGCILMLVILVCIVYSVVLHLQGVMRVSKMEDSNEQKSLYMALSMAGGGVFLLVMAFYSWMNLFVLGYLIDHLVG